MLESTIGLGVKRASEPTRTLTAGKAEEADEPYSAQADWLSA